MENSKNKFEKFSNKITTWTGSSIAFFSAFGIIIIWIVTGPVFHYSDTWQLIINTGTTIITFLMVFLIQKSQNKDGKAIQLKLDELISANKYTSNRMVNIECLSEEDLDKLRDFYAGLETSVTNNEDMHRSHSIDEKIAKETATAVEKKTIKIVDSTKQKK